MTSERLEQIRQWINSGRHVGSPATDEMLSHIDALQQQWAKEQTSRMQFEVECITLQQRLKDAEELAKALDSLKSHSVSNDEWGVPTLSHVALTAREALAKWEANKS